MPTLLWVNACIRGKESRTWALTQKLLSDIKESNKNDLAFHIEEVRLSTENLLPLNKERLERREELLAQENYTDTMFDYANIVAAADMIVISAPYWNMSFPSVLKIFLEAACVQKITYDYAQDGTPIGLCHAKDLYFVTTSGGVIGDCNFGLMYIHAISKLFGIENVHFVSAQGLDNENADVTEILENATIQDL